DFQRLNWCSRFIAHERERCCHLVGNLLVVCGDDRHLRLAFNIGAGQFVLGPVADLGLLEWVVVARQDQLRDKHYQYPGRENRTHAPTPDYEMEIVLYEKTLAIRVSTWHPPHPDWRVRVPILKHHPNVLSDGRDGRLVAAGVGGTGHCPAGCAGCIE